MSMLGQIVKTFFTTKPSPKISTAPQKERTQKDIIFITADGNHSYSPLASTRLRVLIPAMELQQFASVSIFGIHELPEWSKLIDGRQPTAVVIGKLSSTMISHKPVHVEKLLDWLRTYGEELTVFADLSDNYVALSRSRNDPKYEELLITLGKYCRLIAPCVALARRLRPYALKGLDVIEDPWESPLLGKVRAHAGSTIHLAWFGVADQLAMQTVEKTLISIGGQQPSRTIKVEIISGINQKSTFEEIGERVTSLKPNITIRFLPWSLDTTWEALARCDFVLLPQDMNNEWAASKSHNRLVESIRAGRLALASPIESYQELAQYAWVGENLGEGLTWAIENPEKVHDRVKAGQQYIASRFSPREIGRRWAKTLGIITNESFDQPTSERNGSLRLNLGCGDKILQGYINIDIAPARNGSAPDVICDLHSLDVFHDESVDEVMAIHVIEHFWRWEVVDVLREWVRVLKPGGRMILECPNLLSACQEILRNPIDGARSDALGQRTMWSLYGDPRWKDPLMCHRWSYTPESLTSLMEEAGLRNVHQEPAQFKMREPRDMRLVGEK